MPDKTALGGPKPVHRPQRLFTVSTRLLFCLSVLGVGAGTARADIGLGLLSFDELVPGAVNAFAVNNFSFSFKLPPDFPVSDSLVFDNAKLILTNANGNPPITILLGNLDPGPIQDPTGALDFLGTDLFTSAEFTATLSTQTFALSDGTFFLANTNAVDAILLPSAGNTLVAGVDLVPITVGGTVRVPAVPEPSAWLLLATVLALVATLRRTTRQRGQNS